MEEEPPAGSIVWAQVAGYPYWPAQVVSEPVAKEYCKFLNLRLDKPEGQVVGSPRFFSARTAVSPQALVYRRGARLSARSGLRQTRIRSMSYPRSRELNSALFPERSAAAARTSRALCMASAAYSKMCF